MKVVCVLNWMACTNKTENGFWKFITTGLKWSILYLVITYVNKRYYIDCYNWLKMGDIIFSNYIFVVNNH